MRYVQITLRNLNYKNNLTPMITNIVSVVIFIIYSDLDKE